MARVSTTLERIENIKQEQYKILSKQEEERLLLKDYKRDLEIIIKDIIENEFDSFKGYKDTYNNLYLNESDYLCKIEQELSNIKVEKEYQYWNEDLNCWKNKKIIVEKYADIYDFHIIEDTYFKILNRTFNKYNNKIKINKELLVEKLETNIREFFKLKDYDYAYNFMIDYEVRQGAIESIIDRNEEYFQYLDSNYIRILNKVAKEFKYKQVKHSNNTKNNGNFITKHPILTCSLGVAHGLYKGFKNACK